MPNMLNSGELIASIQLDMSDNNAGLISAEDVRHNMEDVAFSINHIVASGDTDVIFPFFNDVRAKHDESEGTGGTFIAESGVIFPNAPIPSMRTITQLEPWPGVASISHDDLDDLTAADTHTQYVSISGYKSDREMTGNLAVGNNWVGASGNDSMGFKFAPNSAGTEDILTSGDLVFGDNSRIANAKGTAKAWCKFSASGDMLTGADTDNAPVIYSWHNIDSLSRLAPGKLKITFTSGTFENNNYVAIGQSNARDAHASKEDFHADATVGLVVRDGDDATNLRSITFCILAGGNYVDADLNDFVAYGYEPNETSGTVPTAIKDPDYNPAG